MPKSPPPANSAKIVALAVVAALLRAGRQRILADLVAILSFYTFSYETFDREPVIRHLSILLRDLRSICQYRATFFACEDESKTYFEDVNRLLRNIQIILRVQQDRDNNSMQLSAELFRARASESRPTLSLDTNSWLQFLTPGAPAIPGLQAAMPSGMFGDRIPMKDMCLASSAIVALPPAAGAIFDEWAQEYRTLLRALSQLHPTHQEFQKDIAATMMPKVYAARTAAGMHMEYVGPGRLNDTFYVPTDSHDNDVDPDHLTSIAQLFGNLSGRNRRHPRIVARQYFQVLLWKFLRAAK